MATRRLFQGAVPTAAPGVPYTYVVATTFRVQVESIQFTNTTGAPISVTVWIVPPGGTTNAADIYLNAVPIPANVNDPDSRLLVLNAGDALAFQATASGLNVTIIGTEQTL